MTKQINRGWITLTITRIVSLFFIVLSIVGFIGAFQFFGFGSNLFSTQQNVAEDQPHGVDALGGLVSVGVGLVWLASSALILILGLITYIVSSKKIKKKKLASQQVSSVESQVQTPTNTALSTNQSKQDQN